MKFKAENDIKVEVSCSGTKYWYQHGKWHREGGPAVIYPRGGKLFYLNDKFYEEKDYWEK